MPKRLTEPQPIVAVRRIKHQMEWEAMMVWWDNDSWWVSNAHNAEPHTTRPPDQWPREWKWQLNTSPVPHVNCAECGRAILVIDYLCDSCRA